MSTIVRTNVAHLVNFEQTHEVSASYVWMQYMHIKTCRTKEKCSHHSVGKPVCASHPVLECLPIRKWHITIHHHHSYAIRISVQKFEIIIYIFFMFSKEGSYA